MLPESRLPHDLPAAPARMNEADAPAGNRNSPLARSTTLHSPMAGSSRIRFIGDICGFLKTHIGKSGRIDVSFSRDGHFSQSSSPVRSKTHNNSRHLYILRQGDTGSTSPISLRASEIPLLFGYFS